MAKNKQRSAPKEREQPGTREASTPEPCSGGPMCPLCGTPAAAGCYYCPECGGEIEFFVHSGITRLSDEAKQKIHESTRRIFYPYFIVSAVYATAWLLLYIFILQKCLNCFVNQ